MARTFQNIRLFQNLTVLENVLIGRHCRLKAGILGAALRTRATREEERRAVEYSYDLLDRFGMARLRQRMGKKTCLTASSDDWKSFEPWLPNRFLLLLDEPAAGMNIGETRELDELILRIRDEEKISVLLIEHDMSLVMHLSDNIFVMDYGDLSHRARLTRSNTIPWLSKRIWARSFSHAAEPQKYVDTYYGNIQALKGVSMDVEEGEIITLLGANGAGKSTTLMSICGVVPPRNGQITFMGQNHNPMSARKKSCRWASCRFRKDAGFSRSCRLWKIWTWAPSFGTTKPALNKTSNTCSIFFPILAKRRHQAGGDLKRRRAADAGHFQGADGATETASAG